MSEVQQYAAQPPSAVHSPSAVHPSGTCAAPGHSRGASGRAAASAAAVSALATAAVASLLASSCCLVPLLLVSVGFSGAWLGNLRILQPYSPILTGIAVVALVFAGESLRRPLSCRVGSATSRTLYRVSFWLIAALTLTLLVSPVVAPWFY
jgi:mercuric ion transport protein